MNIDPCATANTSPSAPESSSQLDKSDKNPLATFMPLLSLVFLSGSLLYLCLLFVGCASNDTPTAIAAPMLSETPIVIPQSLQSTLSGTVANPMGASPPLSTRLPCALPSLAEREEIVLGALLPIFGDKVQTGQSMQIGFNIAVQAINQAGGIAGKPLRIALHDTMDSAELGTQAAEDLIEKHCVVALVGIHKTDIALAVAEVAHREGVPLIVLDAFGDAVTASGYPEVFRIGPSIAQYFQQAAHWVSTVGDYNGDGSLVTVVVAQGSEHGRIQAEFQQQAMSNANIQSSPIYVNSPMNDYSPVIARIVEMEHLPDVIFLRVMGEAGLQLQKQLLDNGITPQNGTLLVAPHTALKTEKYWQLMNASGVHGITTRIGPWPKTTGEMGQTLAKQYRAYYDQWPDNHVFSAHDALYLLADAIERSQSLNSAEIIQALEQTDLQLAAGHYSFAVGSSQLQTEITTTLTTTDTTAPQPDWRWHQWLDAPILYLQYTIPHQDSAEMAVLWPPAYKTIDGAYIAP